MTINKTRLLFCVLLLAGSLGAQESEMRPILKAHFSKADSAFTRIAALPIFAGGGDSLSIQKTLDSLVKSDLPFARLYRTDSSGTILNLALKRGSRTIQLKDLSDEELFQRPLITRTVYRQFVNRMTDYTVLVITRPILRKENGKNLRCLGVLGGEIELNPTLKELGKKASSSFEVLLNDDPVFTRKWTDTLDRMIQVDTVSVSNESFLIIRTLGTEGDTGKKWGRRKGSAPDPNAAKVNEDGRLTTGNSPASSRNNPLNGWAITGMIAGLLLCVGALLMLVRVLRRNHRRSQAAQTSAESEEFFPDEFADDPLAPEMADHSFFENETHPDRGMDAEQLLVPDAALPESEISLPPLSATPLSAMQQSAPTVVEPTAEERAQIIQKLKDDFRQRIRSQIESEILTTESENLRLEARQKVADEMRPVVEAREGPTIEAEITDQLRKQLNESVKEEITIAFLRDEKEPLESRINATLRKELEHELRTRGLPSVEAEIRDEIRKSAEIRVRQEHEKRIKEQCLAELEQRVRQIVNTTQTDALTKQAKNEIVARLRTKIESEEGRQLEILARNELSLEIAERVRLEEYENILARQRTSVETETKEKLRQEETAVYSEEEREAIRNEIRATLDDHIRDELIGIEREKLSRDIHDRLIAEESDLIRAEQRALIEEMIRNELLDKEKTARTEIVRSTLAGEARAAITTADLEEIAEQVREDLADSIRADVLASEGESLTAIARRQCEEEQLARIQREETEAIRDKAYEQLIRDERTRIYQDEIDQIRADLRSQISEEETISIREDLRRHIRSEELESLRSELKDVILREEIRRLEDESEGRIRDIVADPAAGMAGKKLYDSMVNTLTTKLKSDSSSLIEAIRNIQQDVTAVPGSRSLKKTVTLMTEERAKHKYYNLNMTQTGSLLDYLQRLDANFDTYFQILNSKIEVLSAHAAKMATRAEEVTKVPPG